MSVYHDGELWVQRQVGVSEMAARVGRSIKSEIPEIARAFAEERTSVVLSGEVRGQQWVTMLVGPAGFVTATKRALHVDALPRSQDPLQVFAGQRLGLLLIDAASRRRMRVNGTVRIGGSGFDLDVDECYSNCPKYIQRRPEFTGPGAGGLVAESDRLSQDDTDLIERSDTFFIGSNHPERGADASHRGGAPGFVVAVSRNRIEWVDYEGNTMFNTLGNIAAAPTVGLMFPDFSRGEMIQLTGLGSLSLSEGQRRVEFEITRVVRSAGVFEPLTVEPEMSPFNPPLD